MCVSPLIVPRKADGSSCSKLGPPDQTASRQRLPECRQATRVPHQHSGVVVFGRTGSRVRTRPLALFRSGGATILAQHFSAAIRAQTRHLVEILHDPRRGGVLVVPGDPAMATTPSTCVTRKRTRDPGS